MLNLKKLVTFAEPTKDEGFILKETGEDNPGGKKKDTSNQNKSTTESNDKISLDKQKVSETLSDNLKIIKVIYNTDFNSDIIIREFSILIDNEMVNSFMIAIDGAVDRKIIDDELLKPLMIYANKNDKSSDENIGEYVKNRILTHLDVKQVDTYSSIVNDVNFGGCAIFLDRVGFALTTDVKGWEHRPIERPNTEIVIRGPQEAFNEILRANTALIRKRLKDRNLIVESIEIGKRSKTPAAFLYIIDIANESLVDEVRKRLNGVEVDYIQDSGELEQFLEDSSSVPIPQMLSTERPDRVASALADGRVAVILNGSPFALIMPVTFSGLIKSPEDYFIRFPYANALRVIRILGVAVSLLLPSIYLAITNFHQEMIPTDLLLAIASSREKVPFPSIVEILIMEISFELIREAGIRVPSPIGPTLGIIGALILGQAAVAANIVSPILIIIVAVTGLGSFTIPNFSLGYAFRILRFVYILFGAMAGFLGVSLGLFIQTLWFAYIKSFGVPFLTPFTPVTKGILDDGITRTQIWKQEQRPDFLNPKITTKQPKISRTWRKNKKNSRGNSDV